MVSDEEKREIAAKMRAARYDFSGPNIALDIGLEGEYAEGYNARHKLAWLRLADLIEPSIPADPGEAGLACVDAFIREHTEKPVDRDELLALADVMDGHADEMHDGCNFASAGDMRDYARRIREACGVWSDER